jgi:uncharacterized zinc-type alcohol dehydrogenase-like protein
MCKRCGNDAHAADHVSSDRRRLLMGGLGLAAASTAGATAVAAQTAEATPADAPDGPFKTRAFGVEGLKAPVRPMEVTRRGVGPDDVLIDVLYCGVCHSDIHQARDEWATTAPTTYPCVPGHEIIGRVQAVGRDVTKFKVGDFAGVGCFVDSCGTCVHCLDDREQNCLKGATFTYNGPDANLGGMTFGGFSDQVVVKQHYVIRIPPGADLARTAPLLCAGITTFSPLQHWRVVRGQKVGVIGLGGLGHIAVKLAVARGAVVTVFTTTPGKLADARRLGATDAFLWTDTEGLKGKAGQLDLLISTVPTAYPMQPFMDLLKLDATLVNVGALNDLQGLNGMLLASGRRSLSGSIIGGIAETQETIDYCASRNIGADIELIQPDEIDRAFNRVVAKDVRYRFVIDFASAKGVRA